MVLFFRNFKSNKYSDDKAQIIQNDSKRHKFIITEAKIRRLQPFSGPPCVPVAIRSMRPSGRILGRIRRVQPWSQAGFRYAECARRRSPRGYRIPPALARFWWWSW
jgi:hypothetical protein